ncbi:flagellar type III secretion system pore protein FliP [Heliophilum fasciatum]|uniref:Flagellar biosynthetic protein FliP n=1 Tax=Heliophilum fasciatum TaxID=35700 RepID=A0A4R2RWY3_9FIRM|nr:flagellar type III secretion system pore protein FliP [Heliophilum fasciatum]MCW2277929.1 flagellar biosynthetic protein FliP [Heliophilum fasciatum]TCP64501.1 flagellar biosynthetic protein FliP [Heliophilum fasciatum]
MKKWNRWLILFCLFIAIGFMDATVASAAPIQFPTVSIGVESSTEPADVSKNLQILFLLTVLSLAPSILIMMTSFTRILIVMHFTRTALALQTMPPNQILIGLSLFLTFFIMQPTWTQINDQALQPYLAGTIQQDEALEKALDPLRTFMFKQTREKDLALFVNLADIEQPQTYRDIPTRVVIPAYILSELKTAFQIGAVIYLPFIVIDMIVASVLMSMGMMMLPPMMISLPFKVIVFVLADGWYLIIRSLIISYQ